MHKVILILPSDQKLKVLIFKLKGDMDVKGYKEEKKEDEKT